MSRSLKKGPFISVKLEKKVAAMEESGKKSVIKTWSRASMISRLRWSHFRSAQWKQVHSRLCNREHGWSQAWRIRSNSHLPWSRRQQEVIGPGNSIFLIKKELKYYNG